MGETDGERLMKLEEGLLFTDRRLDEMHEQVLALLGKVDTLSARLAAFERVFGESAGRGGEPAPEPEGDDGSASAG